MLISSMAICLRLRSLGLPNLRWRYLAWISLMEVFGLDLLDGVPADDQMIGDILDGHEPGEVESIVREGMGVMFLGIRKGDLDLACLATVEAEDARHGEVDEGGGLADGQGAKVAFDAP